MDRDRLAAWLESPHRTFRWNDRQGHEESERYEGVTTTDDGLRWFRWSHVFEGGPGEGEHDVAHQSFADFRAEGPLRTMPDALRDELIAWIGEHAPS
jgi:hypothetical protein